MFDGDSFSEHSDFRANAEFRVYGLGFANSIRSFKYWTDTLRSNNLALGIKHMSLVNGPLSVT